MRHKTTDDRHDAPELKRLREQCAGVVSGLITDPRTADWVIDGVFSEIPHALRHPSHRPRLEAWVLAEAVSRARRLEHDLAERTKRRLERTAPSREQPWRRLHERGQLLPLLQRLPAAYAEAFSLCYIERVPLTEMVRRTGASAGIVTHRIAEAAARLDTLSVSIMAEHGATSP
jgi:DNA-directed RNA polymerase specialized sigma24 family protein